MPKNTILTHNSAFAKKISFLIINIWKSREKMMIIWRTCIKNIETIYKTVFYTFLSKPLKIYQISVFCWHNTEMATSTNYNRFWKLSEKCVFFTLFSLLKKNLVKTSVFTLFFEMEKIWSKLGCFSICALFENFNNLGQSF